MPSLKGKLNPNYKDGRTLNSSCPICGKLIDYRNSKCQACENKIRFKGKTYEEMYSIERAKKLKELRRKTRLKIIVSKETKQKISDWHTGRPNSFKGKHHSLDSRRNFSLGQGGTGIPYQNINYSSDFTPWFKEKIRTRDKNTCQICGIKHKKFLSKFPIHHIDYNKQNCNENNLITLCISCHIKTNHHRDLWIKFFHQLLSKLGRVEV